MRDHKKEVDIVYIQRKRMIIDLQYIPKPPNESIYCMSRVDIVYDISRKKFCFVIFETTTETILKGI